MAKIVCDSECLCVRVSEAEKKISAENKELETCMKKLKGVKIINVDAEKIVSDTTKELLKEIADLKQQVKKLTEEKGELEGELANVKKKMDLHLKSEVTRYHDLLHGKETGISLRSIIDAIDVEPVPSKKQYKLTIFTGHVKKAGTNADVCVKLFGDKGETEKHKLDDLRRCFERAGVDTFIIECTDLGRLKSLTVSHDMGGGKSPNWFLDKVIVEDIEETTRYEFPCNQWLDRDKGDRKISRDLVASIIPEVEYDITVYTGDKTGAGTDSDVYITLYGEKGASKEEKLDKRWENNFQKGKEDKFTIKTPSLGTLEGLSTRIDDTSSWLLQKVVVEDKQNKAYEFPCGQWLDKNQGDKTTIRELRAIPQKTYEVAVYTGDKLGASTNANVYITFYVGTEETKEYRLDTRYHNDFQRAKKDTFIIHSPNSLGPFDKLGIRHDDSGIGSGWFLDKITVTDREADEVYEFPCKRWLDKYSDDHKISRVLQKGQAFRPETRYEITVFTGDVKGAGTNANVYVTLYGEKGQSEEEKLDRWFHNDFERGKQDHFTIESPHLGPLTKLDVRHDNTGIRPGWFLDKITVTDTYKITAYAFQANRWIDVNEGDKQLVAKLSAKPINV